MNPNPGVRSDPISEWADVAALGILTITAFGSWFYGFGVLIDPIHTDMGWSTASLGAVFGVAQILTGIGAFFGGRLLDRRGGAGTFGLQAVAGGGLFLSATWSSNPLLFGFLYASGAGIIGATGFYHITTAAAARLHPTRPDKAIAIVTVIGALCSPIYLPMTAWLVTQWHWRTAARVLAVLAIAGAVIASIVARGGAGADSTRPSTRPLAAMRFALAQESIRRMLLMYAVAGIAFSSVLVYQVPILTSAGVGIGTAGAIGGLRGFCQIFGRVGLTGAVERFGSGKLLRAAFALSAAGVAFLMYAAVPTGIAYGVVAGTALGASTPLQAMYARSKFDEQDLGLLMGMQGAAFGIAGGIGPFIGGLMHDLTGSWTPTVIMSVGALALAALMLETTTAAEAPAEAITARETE